MLRPSWLLRSIRAWWVDQETVAVRRTGFLEEIWKDSSRFVSWKSKWFISSMYVELVTGSVVDATRPHYSILALNF